MIPLWDNTTPSVVMALDRALRAFGGEPTYALTDNERTVSIDHVGRGAGAQPGDSCASGVSTGLTVATYVPADPQQGRQRGDGSDREG